MLTWRLRRPHPFVRVLQRRLRGDGIGRWPDAAPRPPGDICTGDRDLLRLPRAASGVQLRPTGVRGEDPLEGVLSTVWMPTLVRPTRPSSPCPASSSAPPHLICPTPLVGLHPLTSAVRSHPVPSHHVSSCPIPIPVSPALPHPSLFFSLPLAICRRTICCGRCHSSEARRPSFRSSLEWTWSLGVPWGWMASRS